jgi:uncharacterized OB-fold protein
MEKPLPIVDPGTLPYWDGLKARKLLLKSCKSCGQPHFYPRELCPHCYSDDLDWVEASGNGEIYSYTIAHRPAGPAFAKDVPYVIAIVTLDEGPRMLTRIAGDRPAVRIGQRVRVQFEPAGDDYVLPFFAVVD